MLSSDNKDYIVIVQCDIAMERCSGYFCEKAFHERTGGFAVYPADKPYRTLYLTCGGCCGRALQRKLVNLVSKIGRNEGIGPERIVVQLASCITNDSHHGPPCPHLDYLRVLIDRASLDARDCTNIAEPTERRRRAGVYLPRPDDPVEEK